MFTENYYFKNHVFRFLCCILICLAAGSVFFCGNRQNKTSILFKKDDNSIYFAHRNIALKVLPTTQIIVDYKKETKSLSICSTLNSATHYVVLDDQIVKDFSMIPGSLKHEFIESEFGKGQQISFLSMATGPANSQIEKKINISLFERYPDAAFVRTVYKNKSSDSPVTLNRVYSNMFTLDRKLVQKESQSFDFWTFLGYGKVLGGGHSNVRVNVLPVDKELNVENDSEMISGIPLVDIWSPEMGMAVASVEKRARILKMPVKVNSDEKVNMGLLEEPEIILRPGEEYSALKTAIFVHSLDYYNPIKRYSDVLTDLGITAKPCPQFGYEPFWCNWGYRKDWKTSQGLDRLDEFNEIGIKAITIDDGWFDYYGDWTISKSRFPEGESQLKAWIDSLHSQGLKVIFWWVPCIGGPETVAKHPDWAILDKNGNKTSIHWKDSHMLCPTLPEVIQHHKELTRKFIQDYGFDGFKLDGIYIAPRCYNPAHHHQSSEESYAAYEDVFKAIYETAMEVKPDGDFILGMCPCGALCSPYFLQWGNKPVVADPPQMCVTVRHRFKVYKALFGPTSCVDNDFHERYNEYFPSEFGIGGLMTTKYTTLSGYEYEQFKKWFGYYRKYQLSSGEYLNLYDAGYDVPETYVIKKDKDYFYTFLRPGISGPRNVPWDENHVEKREAMLKAFSEQLQKLPEWQGNVELRGLEKNTTYTVYNLESEEKLGQVKGPLGKLTITFKDHLILRVVSQ